MKENVQLENSDTNSDSISDHKESDNIFLTMTNIEGSNVKKMKSENNMQITAFKNRENKQEQIIPLSIAKKQFTSLNILPSQMAIRNDTHEFELLNLKSNEENIVKKKIETEKFKHRMIQK